MISIKDFLNALDVESIVKNKVQSKKDYFLYRAYFKEQNWIENNLYIVLSNKEKKAYILDNDKEILIEDWKINDEILRFVTVRLLHKYEVSLDFISKILFSPFLWDFLRIANENLHFVWRWKNNENEKKEEVINEDDDDYVMKLLNS